VRRPIVAANWKMNKTVGEAIDLAVEVKRRVAEIEGVDVVACPPFTALKSVGDLLRYGSVALGAQDVHWEAEGAFTGEVSVKMLKDLDCTHVILGHSERRSYFKENDDAVNRKAVAALVGGLNPIICVGETLEQREAGRTEAVVEQQIRTSLRELEGLDRVVVAYEPVWAIGTGKTATTEQVQHCHAFIRGLIADFAGEASSQVVRIQYGGSVNPDNAAELFALPDVDGGLIGGASLDADSFLRIVAAAAPAA